MHDTGEVTRIEFAPVTAPSVPLERAIGLAQQGDPDDLIQWAQWLGHRRDTYERKFHDLKQHADADHEDLQRVFAVVSNVPAEFQPSPAEDDLAMWLVLIFAAMQGAIDGLEAKVAGLQR